jgi:hypothetical protein
MLFAPTPDLFFRFLSASKKVSESVLISTKPFFHDIRRTVKTNMLSAGVDKAHRDVILGHSLQGMDVHYLAPTDDDLKRAMDKFTEWLDDQLDAASGNVEQTVDQKKKTKK